MRLPTTFGRRAPSCRSGDGKIFSRPVSVIALYRLRWVLGGLSACPALSPASGPCSGLIRWGLGSPKAKRGEKRRFWGSPPPSPPAPAPGRIGPPVGGVAGGATTPAPGAGRAPQSPGIAAEPRLARSRRFQPRKQSAGAGGNSSAPRRRL